MQTLDRRGAAAAASKTTLNLDFARSLKLELEERRDIGILEALYDKLEDEATQDALWSATYELKRTNNRRVELLRENGLLLHIGMPEAAAGAT